MSENRRVLQLIPDELEAAPIELGDTLKEFDARRENAHNVLLTSVFSRGRLDLARRVELS